MRFSRLKPPTRVQPLVYTCIHTTHTHTHTQTEREKNTGTQTRARRQAHGAAVPVLAAAGAYLRRCGWVEVRVCVHVGGLILCSRWVAVRAVADQARNADGRGGWPDRPNRAAGRWYALSQACTHTHTHTHTRSLTCLHDAWGCGAHRPSAGAVSAVTLGPCSCARDRGPAVADHATRPVGAATHATANAGYLH
jgi:hypothetical protein